MKFDLQEVNRIVEEAYEPMIVKEHGEEGARVLRDLLKTLHTIYEHIDPEVSIGPITIFKTLNDKSRPLSESTAITIRDLETLPQDAKGPFAIQVLDNGHLLLWNRITPDSGELSEQAVVYVYEDRVEKFFAKRKSRKVSKFYPSCASVFSIHAFGDLREAFEHYRAKMARTSYCQILNTAWYDNKRLFFKNGIEYILRNSLTQFLVAHFRGDAEVRPEQNVDDRHPIDIKVTWWNTKRLALIEIKWLGTPKDEKGKIGKTYSEYRAKEGAIQLAGYLDANRHYAATHTTIGYLVVIDGRRKGLKVSTTSINAEDGLHYEDKEIEYDPEYHKLRTDFAEPVRMFIEPIYT